MLLFNKVNLLCAYINKKILKSKNLKNDSDKNSKQCFPFYIFFPKMLFCNDLKLFTNNIFKNLNVFRNNGCLSLNGSLRYTCIELSNNNLKIT